MREKRRSAALSGIAGAGVMIVLSALLVIGSKPLYTQLPEETGKYPRFRFITQVLTKGQAGATAAR